MKLAPETYYRFLVSQGCDFFSGVPDSLLKAFCSCAKALSAPENFWITCNEGAAVGMAIGQHLASNKIPVVYLQNSGLGNTFNPIASMADPLVYGIPMLLIIGWRGELGSGSEESGPQLKDEPQHRKQGRITLSWLQASDIPYEILPPEQQQAEAATLRLLEIARGQERPVALVVRKNSFADYQSPELPTKLPTKLPSELSAELPAKFPLREAVIAELLQALAPGPVISTTGMISRELFEQREQRGEGHEKDFLVVGAMGHASAIAQGLALALKHSPVYCFDGDGALLMHLGSLAVGGLSECGPKSFRHFKHIVLNNGAHDSVGGQATVALQLDVSALAQICGYKWSHSCCDLDELRRAIPDFQHSEGPALLEVRVRKGARADLGRPTLSSQEIKQQYKAYLKKLS